MDGSDGRTDLRLNQKDSLAIYHRSTSKLDGSCLLIGCSLTQGAQNPALPRNLAFSVDRFQGLFRNAALL